MPTSKELVERLLRELQIRRTRHQGIFPDESGSAWPSPVSGWSDDVDNTSPRGDIMEWAWNRLVPGSMVVFDDYGSALRRGLRDSSMSELRTPVARPV